jgi:CheY-like chemotaxis protein
MALQRVEKIHVAVGDPNPEVRSSIRRALREAGASEIVDFATIEEMMPHLGNISIDLFVSDAELPGGDFCDLVQRIRNHAVGRNPFVAIIANTGVADAGGIQRILGSGVDDLLIKPIRIDILMDRIANLVAARKQFVMMQNYIGPDRRGNNRPDDKNPQVPIAVPNTVRAKMQGAGKEDLEKLVDTAVQMLNAKKMQRYSMEIAYLMKRVQTGIKNNKSVFEIRGDLERIAFVGKELQKRIAGTSAEHAAHLAGSLITVCERAAKAEDGPSARDVDLLTHLAAAIRHAFVTDAESVEAAMEITDAIAKFADKA